jgi:hypothetical protein
LLLALLGPHCRFTRMCMTIAQTALERLYGGCDVITARTLGELRGELDRVQRPHVLLHADTPDAGMCEMLLRSDASYLVVTTDPANVVRDLMAERRLDVCAAIRAASLSFSSLHDIALKPRAIVVRRMGYEYNVEAIVREILRAVGRFPDAQQIDALLAALFPDGQIDGVWSVTRILDSHFAVLPIESMQRLLDWNEVSLVDNVLGDFAQLGSHPFRRAFWPPAMFLSSDTNGGLLPKQVDLVGPFRCPVYGPYVHLPNGTWAGQCHLRVWDNAGRVNYRLDVYSNAAHFEGDLTLPVSGSLDCDFRFSTQDPKGAMQVRLIQIQSAIEGHMEFQGVDLVRAD